jgi:RNA polymerase sigma-70 factor (ECF subfamily)
MVHEQVLDDVKLLIEHLPQNQKEVVFMRYYQGLSFKEIAEVTGVSINTALGRMRYALLNLRRLAVKKELHLAI